MIPIEYFGIGTIKHLKEVLEKYNPNSVFIVTGKRAFISSGAKAAIEPFLENIKTTRFFDFSVNPKIEDVKLGIKLLGASNPELIIAIGGGSVIDMAKLINALSHHDDDVVTAIIKNKVTKQGLPIVAIPTTAGTGSEMTHFAVVYIDNIKYSLAHSSILPSYSIVDPSFTYNLPTMIRATAGIDALCQAVESYWAVAATDESRTYASKAIKILLQNLGKAVCKKDHSALIEISYASNLTGKAINISKTTAAHAISYALTSFHDIPHGHAVAMLLPSLMKINFNESITINQKHIMHSLFGLFGTKTPDDCINSFVNLRNSIGLKGIGCLKLSQREIDRILGKVNLERLNNNPIKITKQMIISILNTSG
jgi:alcohol dehydrogenase class IV